MRRPSVITTASGIGRRSRCTTRCALGQTQRNFIPAAAPPAPRAGRCRGASQCAAFDERAPRRAALAPADPEAVVMTEARAFSSRNSLGQAASFSAHDEDTDFPAPLEEEKIVRRAENDAFAPKGIAKRMRGPSVITTASGIGRRSRCTTECTPLVKLAQFYSAAAHRPVGGCAAAR